MALNSLHPAKLPLRAPRAPDLSSLDRGAGRWLVELSKQLSSLLPKPNPLKIRLLSL